MGLLISSGSLLLTLNRCLAGLDCVVVYCDDIAIFSNTEAQHLRNLKAVFARLQKAGIQLSASKVDLFLTQMDFLGFTVSAEEIRPSRKKVEAIAKFPRLITAKAAASFVGMVGYYREYIPRLSETLAPIYQAINLRPYVRTKQMDACQDHLRKELMSPSLMNHHVCWDYLFILTTDGAPSLGLGGILKQADDQGNLRTVAYCSRALTLYESAYCSQQIEILAGLFAMERWRHFLQHTVFLWVVDCTQIR
jgi:hypothetical protein